MHAKHSRTRLQLQAQHSRPTNHATTIAQLRRQEEAARFLARSKEDYEAESKKQIERALAAERRRMQNKLAKANYSLVGCFAVIAWTAFTHFTHPITPCHSWFDLRTRRKCDRTCRR